MHVGKAGESFVSAIDPRRKVILLLCVYFTTKCARLQLFPRYHPHGDRHKGLGSSDVSGRKPGQADTASSLNGFALRT